MASIFERTMNACLESRQAAKKNSLKKTINESKKTSTKKLTESDELTDELDDAEDLDDEFADDVVDDAIVVVDPEMSEDEVSDAAAEAQEIVDGTPEGEVPSTDEYIGDYTYTCPICGNTFFSDTEMHDGDECPVCGEFPDGYVLVGQVESTEEATDEETPDEDLEPAEPEEELIPDEESVEPEVAYSEYSLNEKTFHPFMNKFIRENYKNAKSFAIVGASKSGKKLKIECKITFKSNNTKNVALTVGKFEPKTEGFTMVASEDGAFKSESKKGKKAAPFIFECKMNGKKEIMCVGMKYNFITTISENKKAQISGKLVRESKKANFQRGRRK